VKLAFGEIDLPMRKGWFSFSAFLSFLGAAELVKGYAGVYVLSLGKFELATSAYTVDKLIDTPAEKFYRIQPKTLIFDALRSMSIFSPSRSRTSAAPWISSCM